MNKKLTSSILVAAVLSCCAFQAQADYNDPATYAQDKLLNAEAQLSKLKEQRKALDKLIKAVKADLKAAKTRAKAEKIQSKADGFRSDASTLVENSGLAVDLPDFMISQGVDAKLTDRSINPDSSELMFKEDRGSKSAFFPGRSKGIESDVVLPPNVREIK